MTKDSRPAMLLDPAPRSLALMFRPEALTELRSLVRLVPDEAGAPTVAQVESLLPDVEYIMGQTDLDRRRLEKAGRLKAIFNVESNFQPNVDYDYCFQRGIHVLSVSPVFAQSVAEIGLGMALDLARGISRGDRQFRRGEELYGLDGNQGAFTLAGKPMGIIGFGDLGQALYRLLAAFRGRVLVHDPWMPPGMIREVGGDPVDLETLRSESRAVFVTASVTSENEGFLGKPHFDLMANGAIFVLLSRAGVVDFDALTQEALTGRIRVATDVFPEEPLSKAHPIRDADTAVLSAHRAGALTEAFYMMGELVLDDLKLLMKGLPPRRCKRAERETVGRLRSRPVDKS
ncbi:MAG: hydroxyacid dehydrogenase [Spirochaetota bacterium]